MQRFTLLVWLAVVLVIGCGDSGDSDGGMFVDEPAQGPCRRAYDSTYDVCIDELSTTCIGIACLFIIGECQSEALRAAGLCCVNTTSTQQEYDACIQTLPGADLPTQ